MMTSSEQQGGIPEELDPFIGLKRDSSDPNSETFLWSDGSPVDMQSLWAPLEPSNYEGQESCARIYTGEYYGGWGFNYPTLEIANYSGTETKKDDESFTVQSVDASET